MNSTPKIYTVLTANPKGHFKSITVRGGSEASVAIRVHRYALVGKGDRIRFAATGTNRIFVVSKDESEPDIPLTPFFSAEGTVSLGNDTFKLRVNEVSSAVDLRALEFLEQFHYRTNRSLTVESPTDKDRAAASSIGGRRAVLCAAIRIGEHWHPAGYVDLQMPLMMCKPRHDLFNHPFAHPHRPIAWDRWDQHAMRRHLNAIVRIGRIVVTPELRGLGITRRIIAAAKEFAAERWHVGGVRPIFMEISAEMLSHVDFVSSSSFTFAGKTEGNLSRVIRDMEQMSREPRGEFGIMSLQRKYYRTIDQYCKTQQISFKKGLDTLRRRIEQSPDALTAAEWAVLRTIVRNPIPYYLCPLDDYASEYLLSALKANPPEVDHVASSAEFSAKSTRINVDRLSIRASYRVPETKSTKMIMDAFGLTGDIVYADIVQNVSVKASNGNIILLVGTSGSGKTVFLNALDPNKPVDGNLSVERKGMLNYTAGWLRPLRHDIPIFEALAEKSSPRRTFAALSRVGLSEALVFVKPFWMLSRGQQYRAMIAELLLRDEEVWLLDEFCTDLDPITAKTVAHNLRKQVIATGRIAIVAAANHAHYLDALRPTRILMLRSGDQPAWLSFKEYQDEFLSQVG